MRRFTTIQLACAVIMALFGAIHASAYNTAVYAPSSKLATGKWVKITIPENGVYEITYDELRAMGFNNPEQVKLYGYGGAKISEVLSTSTPDDLTRVPMLRTNNKICFYGNGPIAFSISDYNTTPRYVRTFNPYSQVGCYFLGETSEADLAPTKRTPIVVNNYIDLETSLDYFYHESEQTSVANSGKEMLGEDMSSLPVYVDYDLPGLADSSIVVHTVIAANASDITYANAVIHSGSATDTTVYTTSSSRIYKPSGANIYYNYAQPFAALKLTEPAEHGQFEPFLKHAASVDFTTSVARLDYFILSYKHRNVIRTEDDNQILMGYALTRGNERFKLPNASSSTVVWSVHNPKIPVEISVAPYNDASGTGLSYFAAASNTSLYVAFDPTKTLKKISSFEPVENQNLHAMPVPDMLIITTPALHEQAQRLADIHAAVDGIDVAVVDHEQIFNEFSSGTRDAMAYRRLCKMLFDRNNTKFKNLLMFGTGSFDNRELFGAHPEQLLTYQSDNSNYEDFTYTTDDFFGFLADGSGSNIATEKLSIGVGRITSADVEEAKSDVDKFAEYYANPDYGVWRNNTVTVSDSPDKGMFMFQGEGYKNQIDNKLSTGMHAATIHNTQYPRSETQDNVAMNRKTATEAKQKMSDLLKSGAYFATYVGHAGPVSFTKYNNLWTTSDVAATAYKHLPIFTTACCDVAHYDNNSRGIAELMFHKRDGGAIALLTTSRMVYASGNDLMNIYFIESMFSNAANGYMPTLGEAYKNAKRRITGSDANKLSFLLLGDPALKVNYPVSLFNIMKVNGINVTDTTALAQISPLMRFEVEAQVVDADGNLDTSFNGDATMTLYDRSDFFVDLVSTDNVLGKSVTRSIYFDRDKLGEVNGRVINGVFRGSMIAPKSPLASNDSVLLRVYAHKDNSDRMVNGFTKRITMLPYNESLAITDNQSPVITTMFINDESSFAEGASVGTNSMLYITATDDQGINVQPNAINNSMTLSLDGGKPSYSDIDCYATIDDEGRLINIEFPLNNLAEGMHTLTYTVYDMLGNSATRTITFVVGQNGVVDMTADKLPAFLDGEVNFDIETSLTRTPEVIVRVTDATGKLMWMTTANSFPVAWDMRDMNGNKVPAGLYRYFGTYTDGSNYGGTPINKLIVLDPVKRAQ